MAELLFSMLKALGQYPVHHNKQCPQSQQPQNQKVTSNCKILFKGESADIGNLLVLPNF